MAGRNALLNYFNVLKGIVAAGEAAAHKLDEMRSDKPNKGGLL